ncbi:hypothetical protein N9137_01060 [Pseudomonadales bacterium]|nr:hypothetical protein [Pseudomonadales bacterium]
MKDNKCDKNTPRSQKVVPTSDFNYEIKDLSKLKPFSENIRYGFRYAWANPSVLIVMSYDNDTKTIHVWDESYKSKVHREELTRSIKDRVGKSIVFCDPIDPSIIAYMNSRGVSAIGAIRYKNSVLNGMKFLRSHKIIVDPKCTGLISELQSPGGYGYAIDAMRYGLEIDIIESSSLGTEGLL